MDHCRKNIKRNDKRCDNFHAIGFDDFLRKREFVSERTTFLSLNQESVSRWSRFGRETEYLCLNSLPRTYVLPYSQFASQVLPYSSLFPVSGNSWKEIFIAGSEEAKVDFYF